jgi:hypothetical protein
MEMSVQLHAPAISLLGKQPPTPIGQEAVWSPEPAWALPRREQYLGPVGNHTVPQRTLLEKLIVAQLVKKFSGTRNFMTVFTRARLSILS